MFEEWSPTLTKEQIIDYLCEWQQKGFHVIEKRPPIIDGWIIELDSTRWVGIRPGGGSALWSVCIGNLGRSIGQVGTLRELKEYVEVAWGNFGVPLGQKPLQRNTYSSKPISNKASLVSIIGSSSIKSIQDDFFDNVTLKNLIDIHSLGVKFNPAVKILTTKEKIKSGRLTETIIKDFSKEMSLEIEVRYQDKDHHRLIMTDDNRCISPDFSLNSFESKGSITEIQDANEKIMPFDADWKKATTFYKS